MSLEVNGGKKWDPEPDVVQEEMLNQVNESHFAKLTPYRLRPEVEASQL